MIPVQPRMHQSVHSFTLQVLVCFLLFICMCAVCSVFSLLTGNPFILLLQCCFSVNMCASLCVCLRLDLCLFFQLCEMIGNGITACILVMYYSALDYNSCVFWVVSIWLATVGTCGLCVPLANWPGCLSFP